MKRIKKILQLLILGTCFLYSACSVEKSYQKSDDGILVHFEQADLKIKVFADNIIRVEYDPIDSIPERPSLIVEKIPAPVKFNVDEKDGVVSLKTNCLELNIDSKTGLIKFFDKNGNILLKEKSRDIIADIVMDENVYNIQQEWTLSDDEGIYGLGQHQDGHMNYRGTTDTLIQTNTVAVNPFLISTKGYGILWDNYSKTIFNDDESGAGFWSEVGDKIDYYFIAGQDMDEVIAGYRDATGQAPMFGKWAFGYWQSKERYKDANDLLSVVKEYRKRKIPIDNIVQDWCYWADYDENDSKKTWKSAKELWSSMYFHPSTYSDPEKIIAEIHDKYNIHYMISIWPALGPETAIYKELNKKGLIYPPEHWSSGYLYDAFSREARDIYWKHIKEGLISKGVDALWMDGTEPELGDQHTFEISENNIKKFGQTELGTMARYMNAYSLMTTSGAYENFRKDFPEKRFFTLTRSAFAGQQKNAAVTWSGDINARFDVMRDQISSGLNFCMAGIPYWTTDIGAFFLTGHDVDKGPGLYPGGHTDPSYRELYVRWFQYGAFCPIFRSHGTHTPREIWRFGEKGDWAYEALLKYDNLRYRLMPYIYSLAWKVTNDGYTMMRGLVMDFTNDKKVYNIDNQFMFGPSILVNPVTEHQYFPIDKEVSANLIEKKDIELYLPAGTEWYDFWTGEKYNGGQIISRETPIDIMPLFVKAGSIIPMGPKIQYATEKPVDPIELRVYTGADAEFVLYEDENDNYNYEKGIYSTILIKWIDQDRKLIIEDRKGEFPGMLKERTFNIVWVGKNHGIGVNPVLDFDKTINYKGKTIKIEL